MTQGKKAGLGGGGWREGVGSLIALQNQRKKPVGREASGHTSEGVTAKSPKVKKPGSACRHRILCQF